MGLASLVRTLSGQSSEALPTGSSGALSLQLAVTDDDPFEYEMRSTSIVSVAMRASTSSAATTETASRDCTKSTNEATIPLEAKELKRGGGHRKAHKKSWSSHHEKELRW